MGRHNKRRNDQRSEDTDFFRDMAERIKAAGDEIEPAEDEGKLWAKISEAGSHRVRPVGKHRSRRQRRKDELG